MFNCITFTNIKNKINPAIDKQMSALQNCLADSSSWDETSYQVEQITGYVKEIITKEITPLIVEGLQNDPKLQKYFKEYVNSVISQPNKPILENFQIISGFILEKFLKDYLTEVKSEALKKSISEVLQKTIMARLSSLEKTPEKLKLSLENNLLFLGESKISDDSFSFNLEVSIQEALKNKPAIEEMIKVVLIEKIETNNQIIGKMLAEINDEIPFNRILISLTKDIETIIATHKPDENVSQKNTINADFPSNKNRDVLTPFQQFDSVTAYAYLKRLASAQIVLSSDMMKDVFLQEMLQQFYLVNCMGKDIIRPMPTSQLILLLDYLRKNFKADHFLILITAFREMLYRTSQTESPIWLNNAQISTLLVNQHLGSKKQYQLQYFDNLGDDNPPEIREEQLLICFSLSVIKWFKGETVIIASNTDEIEEFDRKILSVTFNVFCNVLNIPFSKLPQNSQEITSGIYYADYMDLLQRRLEATTIFYQTPKIDDREFISRAKSIITLVDNQRHNVPLLNVVTSKQLYNVESSDHSHANKIEAIIQIETLRGNIIPTNARSNAQFEVHYTHALLELADDGNTTIELRYDSFEKGYGFTITTAQLPNRVGVALQIMSKIYHYDFTLLMKRVSSGKLKIELDFKELNITFAEMSELFLNLTTAVTDEPNSQFREELNNALTLTGQFPVPPKDSMVTVINDVHRNLLNSIPDFLNHPIAPKILIYLNYKYLNIGRDNIYYYYFLPIVKIISEFIDEHNSESNLSMSAMINYAKSVSTENNNFTAFLPFKNLKDLINNERARRKMDNQNLKTPIVSEQTSHIEAEKQSQPSNPRLSLNNIEEEALLIHSLFVKNKSLAPANDDRHTFIERCANLQNSPPQLNGENYGVEVALQILVRIGQQKPLNGQTQKQLLVEQKKRAINIVEQFTLLHKNNVEELLKFIDLEIAKDNDELSPYSYLRKEQGMFRFTYGNTKTWETITGLIKSMLFEFHQDNHFFDNNALQYQIYQKIMASHRKHTYGFGFFFTPRRSSEVARYYELTENKPQPSN